jgi:hypothetical protein
MPVVAVETPVAAVESPVAVEAPVAAVETPVESPAFIGAAASPAEREAEPIAQLDERPAAAERTAPAATPESVLAHLKSDWPADLVQVETDPDKLRPLPPFEELLGLQAGRNRPVLVPPSDEPLIQVETRKREGAPGSPEATRAEESTHA